MLYINGDAVNVTIFPDNTSQVWKLDKSHLSQGRATIRWEFSHEGEITHLAQLKTLLDLSVDRVYLNIDYLPYGRQDKNVSNGTTFALWTFAKFINAMNFTEIFIMDPHSKIALSMIDRSQAVYPHGPLKQAYEMTNSNLVCYPDSGAVVKYTQVYDIPATKVIYGEKVRNQATGHIINYKLVGNCKDKKVLIVDDICDGGKTFELLANELYSAGAEEVNLFVTHGLFTKGLNPLHKARIRRIFTNKGEAVQMSDGGFEFRRPV